MKKYRVGLSSVSSFQSICYSILFNYLLFAFANDFTFVCIYFFRLQEVVLNGVKFDDGSKSIGVFVSPWEGFCSGFLFLGALLSSLQRDEKLFGKENLCLSLMHSKSLLKNLSLSMERFPSI